MSFAGAKPWCPVLGFPAEDDAGAGVEGEKLNFRRSLYATSRGDIIDSGRVIERGELTDSALEGDHMAACGGSAFQS